MDMETLDFLKKVLARLKHAVYYANEDEFIRRCIWDCIIQIDTLLSRYESWQADKPASWQADKRR